MAGNPEHEEALRTAHPDAETVRCDGINGGATITYSGHPGPVGVSCPGCEREKAISRIGAFIPPRFRGPVGMPAEVTAWVDRGRDAQGLYLTGQVGTGKTHTAWFTVGHWCLSTGTVPHTPRNTGVEGWSTAGPTVIFTRMTDLLDDLRPGDHARQRVRDCQRAALLVIDDIGAEKPSEWTQERIYSIVDHRYANCMPLIVTGNLPPKQLGGQVGERAASRLAEMCVVVAMTGTDRRRPGA